jgi:hypothetical protein
VVYFKLKLQYLLNMNEENHDILSRGLIRTKNKSRERDNEGCMEDTFVAFKLPCSSSDVKNETVSDSVFPFYAKM